MTIIGFLSYASYIHDIMLFKASSQSLKFFIIASYIGVTPLTISYSLLNLRIFGMLTQLVINLSYGIEDVAEKA